MKQVFFAFLVVLGSYAAAFAHSKSVATTPADASRVTAVDQIEIRFDDPMRVTAVSLVGPNGDTPLERQTGLDPTTEFVATPEDTLQPGHYEVEWRGLSGDGHPMEGSFSFEVVE